METIIGDESFRYTADWNGADKTKLFTNFSDPEMATTFNSLGTGELKEVYNLLNGEINPGSKVGFLSALGIGKFDFADDMAAISKKGGNSNQGVGTFPDDGTGGFIKFEKSNTLYNVYDAGNFMTGKGFNLVGAGLNAIKKGADIHSRVTGEGPDTPADQKALTNGFNYTGVSFPKKKI